MILSQCCGGGRGIIRSQLNAMDLEQAHVGCLAHVSSMGAFFFVGATLIRSGRFFEHDSLASDVPTSNVLRSKEVI